MINTFSGRFNSFPFTGAVFFKTDEDLDGIWLWRRESKNNVLKGFVCGESSAVRVE